MRKTILPFILVALLSGFAGGFVFQSLGTVVIAQALPAELMETKELRIVDGTGRTFGRIAVDAKIGGLIQLFDQSGQISWTIPEGPAKVLPLSP